MDTKENSREYFDYREYCLVINKYEKKKAEIVFSNVNVLS